MSILNNKVFAVVVSGVLILASIFGLGGQRLLANKSSIENYFISGGAMEQTNIIWGQGQNMLVVAQRYVNQGDPLVMPLAQALNNLEEETEPSLVYAQAIEVANQINILNRQRYALAMTDTDNAHFDYVVSHIISSLNILRNNNYNEKVDNFNESLQVFPANIISQVRGISHLEELPQ